MSDEEQQDDHHLYQQEQQPEIMNQEQLQEAILNLQREKDAFRAEMENTKVAYNAALKKQKQDMDRTLAREREILDVTYRAGVSQNATASSVLGTIEPFVAGRGESWSLYIERVLIYLNTNNVKEEDRKVCALLTLMGPQNYKLLRNSLFPDKPEKCSWKVINEHMKKIHEDNTHFMVERAKFLSRVQLPGESVSNFMAQLRGLAEFCDFDDLDQALVSQTISGLRDLNLKTKILKVKEKAELSFKNIETKASAYEAAKRNASSLSRHNENGATHGAVHNLYWKHPPQQQPGGNPKQHNGRARNFRQSGMQAQADVHGHQRQGTSTDNISCYRCGGSHKASTCFHVNTKCLFCNKTGHLKRVCFKFKKHMEQNSSNRRSQASSSSTKDHKKANTNYMELEKEIEDFSTVFEGTSLYHMSLESKEKEESPPIILPLLVNQKYINMEVDSGAASSVIGMDTYCKLWPEGLKLHNIDRNLHTWSKELLLVKGCAIVDVELNGKIHQLPLIIMYKAGPCIVGRNWFKSLNINMTYDCKSLLANITEIQVKKEEDKQNWENQIPDELKDYKEVFSPGLGKYSGPPVSIELKETAKPVFRPARQVPYARQKKAEETIEEHVQDGFMSSTKFSEYGTPVLFVTCSDGTLRMVGDYSGTVNPMCKVDIFPMPTVDTVLDNLSGGKFFTKLDLKRAFNQITVDEKTAEILTLNTSKGLFKVHRLSPGLSAAPAIFQRTMSGILSGIKGVTIYFDDVLIQGATKEELWSRTREVLERLQNFGLKLNLKKCIFCVTELDFIGYHISGSGVKPTEEKVTSLVNMPHPKDKPELQSFIGYVNYYDRFLQNKAEKFYPLYQLLHDGVQWKWGEKEKYAVEYVKKVMTSDMVLAPYNPNIPIILAVDASPVGLGYVISHIYPDGIEKPIAYGSRTLQPAEKNYSQVDKEALAIVSGVKKFNKYLSGREFTILTDHKPLLGIFKPDKSIPETLSPRLIRWCLFLSGYQYQLKYRPGKQNGNADCLSRLPVPAEPDEESPDLRGILLLENAPPGSPITAENIAVLTRKDPALSRVLNVLLHGGSPEELPEEFRRRAEGLSVSHKCILYGDRVVIPKCLHTCILKNLHKHHIGIVKMKSVARSYVFWPNIDKDIENIAKSCVECASVAKNPPKEPILPWITPKIPWSRLHIDFAGPYKNKTFLIIVDSYTKWIDIIDTNHSLSSQVVIKSLRQLFSVHGICDKICSDNGPAFRSAEFKEFCDSNLINHVTIADYKAATNGQAERTVQTVKNILSKLDPSSWSRELPGILLTLRSIPNATTGLSPAEMLMGRKLRTMFDKLHPVYSRSSQLKGEECMSKKLEASKRSFKLKDLVWYRIYNKPYKWDAGVVFEVEGPRNYKILNSENTIIRRHIDQLRSRQETEPSGKDDSNQPVSLEDMDNDSVVSNSDTVNMPELEFDTVSSVSDGDSVASTQSGVIKGDQVSKSPTGKFIPVLDSPKLTREHLGSPRASNSSITPEKGAECSARQTLPRRSSSHRKHSQEENVRVRPHRLKLKPRYLQDYVT